MRHRRCCREGKYLFTLELPQTLDSLLLYRVWFVISNHVILIQNNHLTPRSFSVKYIYRGYCYTKVNNSELFCSLHTQMFIWFHYCHVLTLFTYILGNETLNPCFTRGSWWDDNNEWFLLWNSNCSYCCLVVTVSVLWYFIADSTTKIDEVFQWHFSFQTSCLLLVKGLNFLSSHMRILELLFLRVLQSKSFPLVWFCL